MQMLEKATVNPNIETERITGLCTGAKRFSNGKNKQSPSGIIKVKIT